MTEQERVAIRLARLLETRAPRTAAEEARRTNGAKGAAKARAQGLDRAVMEWRKQ